jgi:hypothetical protein
MYYYLIISPSCNGSTSLKVVIVPDWLCHWLFFSWILILIISLLLHRMRINMSFLILLHKIVSSRWVSLCQGYFRWLFLLVFTLVVSPSLVRKIGYLVTKMINQMSVTTFLILPILNFENSLNDLKDLLLILGFILSRYV